MSPPESHHQLVTFHNHMTLWYNSISASCDHRRCCIDAFYLVSQKLSSPDSGSFCFCVRQLRDLRCRFTAYPVSTGIFPHSLPKWAFRARPGLWRICLCPKVAELLSTKLVTVTVRAKLGQTSSCANGPQIWCPIGKRIRLHTWDQGA